MVSLWLETVKELFCVLGSMTGTDIIVSMLWVRIVDYNEWRLCFVLGMINTMTGDGNVTLLCFRVAGKICCLVRSCLSWHEEEMYGCQPLLLSH